MATTFEDVVIRVTQRGADEAGKAIGLIGKESEKATGAVAALNRVMYTLAAAISVKSLTDTISAYQSMSNSLKIVTKNATELAATQERLFKMAQTNRTAVEDLTDLYVKLALSQKEIGISGERIYKVVDTISKALANNGKGSQAAAAGLKQLIQGLQSGRLAGEELKSVLENTPYLAQQLAKGLNVPLGKLREMGAAGELTAQRVVQAFEKMAPTIAADFNKMNITISQALTVLDNAWKQFIGGAGEASGASKLISQSIVLLANNLGTVVTALGAATAAWIAYRVAVVAVATAQAAANLLINANPIVRLVTIVLTATAALIALTGNTENAVKWVTDLGKSAYSTFQEFVKGASAGIQYMTELVTSVTTAATNIENGFKAGIQAVWDFIKGWYEWLVDLVGTQIPKAFKEGVDSIYKFFVDGFTKVQDFITGIFNNIRDALNRFVSWASGVISSIVSAAQNALATIKSLGSGSKSSEVSGARASGGPVSGGKTYLVGENGPELFSPSVNGTIIPNGGSGTATSFGGSNPAKSLETILTNTLGIKLQALQDLNTEIVKKLGDLVELNTKISSSTAQTNSTVQASAVAATASGGGTSAINNYVQNGMTAASVSAAGAGYASVGGANVASAGGGGSGNSLPGGGNSGSLISVYGKQLASLMKRYEQNIATDYKMQFSRTKNAYSAVENFKASLPADIRDKVIEFANGLMPPRMGATADLSGIHNTVGQFRSGGSFTIPGGTGVDSKIVPIRATPGEEVTIRTPKQQREAEEAFRGSNGGNTIIFQIQTPDADSFRKSQKQILREFAVQLGSAMQRS